MIRWLLDVIDTEVAKPDEEADMALVEECTALLGELTGETCSLSERELKKRCRAITHGGKNVRKQLRLTAAIAACLAVFVIMSGCGYLPSITTIIQTIFASGVGKDVEIHEITYTFQGMGKQYNDVKHLVETENLNILVPTELPENLYITQILRDDSNDNIFILFNDPALTFQIFPKVKLEDHIVISDAERQANENFDIYTKKLSNTTYIAYCEIDNNVYGLQYSNPDIIYDILTNLR